MNVLIRLIVISLFLSLLASPVAAQTADDYHPFLSDKFTLSVGAFWPKVDFTGQLDGSDPGDGVDFDEVLNMSTSQTTPAIGFLWRFGEKWSLGAEAWTIDNSGKAVLEEDITWNDVTFREGTNVGGGVGLDVVRVFMGRKFTTSPKHEFGLGVGLHYLSFNTYLEGEIFFDDDSTGFHRESASADFPLPDIGAWYMYSFSPKWLLAVRGDWLSATIGDYSGSLWDLQFGVNYQAFKNIGFGLSYKMFLLDVDVDKGDFHGRVDLEQAGPALAVTAIW